MLIKLQLNILERPEIVVYLMIFRDAAAAAVILGKRDRGGEGRGTANIGLSYALQ